MVKRKRALSLIVCVMLLASLIPAAYAADGARSGSLGGVFASVALTGTEDKCLFSADSAIESMILSPDELTDARYLPIAGASYDKRSNTLTLTDFDGAGVVLELTMMGADFKLRLAGSSTLEAIRCYSLGYGCSLDICGDGSLTIDASDGPAIVLDAGGADDFVRVASETRLTAESSAGSIRVIGSRLGDRAIRFETSSPYVVPWDSTGPLKDKRTTDGATIDVYTLPGEDGLFGIEAVIEQTVIEETVPAPVLEEDETPRLDENEAEGEGEEGGGEEPQEIEMDPTPNEIVVKRTVESLVYVVYRLDGTDANGDYYAEETGERLSDISAYRPANSPSDVSLYVPGGAYPASKVRFAPFEMRAEGSDEHGSVSISPAFAARGGCATVSVRPAEGCKLRSLTINGNPVQVSGGSYTVNNISGDVLAEAVFVETAPAALRTAAPASTEFFVPADGAGDCISEPFTAAVVDADGDALGYTILWSISPEREGVSIGADGRVHVTSAARVPPDKPASFTVGAAAQGTDFFDESMSFTVSLLPSEPYAIKLMRADLPVEDSDTITIPAEGETASVEYRAVVLDPYGTAMNVAALWAADCPAGVSLDEGTILVTDACAEGAETTLTVTAENYSEVSAALKIRFGAAQATAAEGQEQEKEDGDETRRDVMNAAAPAKAPTRTTAKTITAEMITVPEKLAYTGKALTPAVTVKDGETELKENEDYTLLYENNTEPGTASVTVTGKGERYTGTVRVNFRIVSLEITWPTRTEAEGKSYGAKLSELITLGEDGTARLDPDAVEGTFSLSDPESVPDVDGKYRLVFTPTDEDMGEIVSEEYSLTKLQPKALSADMVSVSPASVPYSDEPQTPAVLVRNGSVTAVKDKDFTVSYENNIEIGTAKANVTGTGNYSGTASASFQITAIPAAALAAGVQITPCTPESETIRPTLTIKYGEKTLTEGTDYEVEYLYDINTKTGTAAIGFKGIYSGTLRQDFKLPNYLVTEGAGSSWSKSSTKDLRFRANGALGKFTGLTVDGKEVSELYYATESGSTIVYIKPDYLKTLTAGKHIVGFLYQDGKALAIFSVTAAPRRGVATGDGNNAGLWLAVMAASMVAFGTLLFLFFRDRRPRKKKKRSKRQ